MLKRIQTPDAPQAIGPYSQAIAAGNTVYFSGQIAIDPMTASLVSGGITEQMQQIMRNMQAVAAASGGALKNIVKLSIFLTDLANFEVVNTIMQDYFRPPYPARSTFAVKALPKAALVEIEAIMVLP